MSKSNETTVFTVLMFLAMLSWGGSWPSGKVVADYTNPEVIVFWRFLATFVAFIPVIIALKVPLKLNKNAFIQVLIGSVLLVAYNQLFFIGLKAGLAGAGGVLVTTLIPLCTFLFTGLIFKQKMAAREIAGLALGLVGGLVLLKMWELDLSKLYLGGNLLFLLAAMVWALLTITTQKSQKYMSSLVFSFYIYGFSSMLDLAIALPYDVLNVFNFGYKFWLNMLNLSVVVTTFGTTIYFFASSKLGASKASSFTFLVPTSALIFSWLWLKEQPQITTLIGGLLAMSAVYLINRKAKELPEAKVEDN